MVGFGKLMLENQVPEWSTEYLPYKKMKKMLKRIVAQMSAEEAAMNGEGGDDGDAEDAAANKERHDKSGRLHRSESAASVVGDAQSLTTSNALRKRRGLISVRTDSDGGEAAWARADYIRGCSNRGGGGAESDSDRDSPGPSRRPSSDAAARGGHHHHHAHATPTVPFMSTTVVGGTTEDGDAVFALEDERNFFALLDASLGRVVAFYAERLRSARDESEKEAQQLSHLVSETKRLVDLAKKGVGGAAAAARKKKKKTEDEEDEEDEEEEVEAAAAANAPARDDSLPPPSGHLPRASSSEMSLTRRARDPSLLKRFQDKLRVSGSHRVVSPADELKASIVKARNQARILRKAIVESYRGVNMLGSYVSLNMEAFRKIVKKHDKRTGWQTQETYMKSIHRLCVFNDEELEELRGAAEEAYLRVEEVLCQLEPKRWQRATARWKGVRGGSGAPGFYEIRRRRNELLAELRQDTRSPTANGVGPRKDAGPRFKAGLALGAAAALLVTFFLNVSSHCWDDPSSLNCDAVASVAPAIRAPLLIAAHVLLYGVAVQAWKATGVNAPFIMQAKRGTELSATGAVFAGSLGACAWTIASMIIVSRAVSAVNEAGDGGASLDDAVDVDVLRAHELTSIFQASFGSMLFGALIFLYPWPEFGRVAELMKRLPPVHALVTHPPTSTRRFFLSALYRGVTAPMYRVRMIDFFLMDQVVSQTTALRDFFGVFLLCFGGDGAKWAFARAGVVAIVPSYLRFAQCLRRYRDEGHFVQVLNAGKYFAGATAVSLGLLSRVVEDDAGVVGGDWTVDDAKGWRHAFNVFTLIAIAYAMSWDFLQDWSVFIVVRDGGGDGDDDDDKEGGGLGGEKGLGGPRCGPYRATALSRRLMLSKRWKYWLAIAVNAALRNVWILASVPLDSRGSAASALGAEAWITLFAVLEVSRRGMWNYFRVENEHTTNCGQYRATLEVPLPYADDELTDDERDEDDRDDDGGALIASSSMHSRAGSDGEESDGDDAPVVELVPQRTDSMLNLAAMHLAAAGATEEGGSEEGGGGGGGATTPPLRGRRRVSLREELENELSLELSRDEGEVVIRLDERENTPNRPIPSKSSGLEAIRALLVEELGAGAPGSPGSPGSRRRSMDARRRSVDLAPSATPPPPSPKRP